MTNLPLTAWRIVAGPPGIEIGAKFYESIFDRKNGGRGVVRPAKKRRKFARKINGLQAHSAICSVTAKAAQRQRIRQAA